MGQVFCILIKHWKPVSKENKLENNNEQIGKNETVMAVKL